jgi:hypothetical protein
MAKQTAVDWLVSQIEEYIRKSARNELGTKRGGDFRIGLRKAIDFCEQAKQIEKEQIKVAYNKGYQDGEIDSLDAKDGDVQYFDDAEQYYNETYGTE